MLADLRVTPGEPARLADRDPRDGIALEKAAAEQRTVALRDGIDDLQHLLHAEATRAVLLVLQGVDASGKHGVIRRVFAGVNPQGVRVVSFKAPGGRGAPARLPMAHPRCASATWNDRVNRSPYEDIVTVGVIGLAPEAVWRRRARHIREFERMLVAEGTAIVKVFLSVSKDEQAERTSVCPRGGGRGYRA